MTTLTEFQYWIYIVRLVGTVICSIATALNILLIIDMRIWNPHTNLIFAMNIYQLMYDSTILSISTDLGTTIQGFVGFVFAIWGGTSAALVSNLMILSVLAVISKKQQYHRYLTSSLWVNISVNIPSGIAIIFWIGGFVMNDSKARNIAINITNYTKDSSVILSFLCYFYLYYLIRHIFVYKTAEHRAIRELARRLKYYPITLAYTRILYAIYYYQYGPTLNPPNKTNTGMFVTQLVFSCSLILSGVSLFLIFLWIQPNAFNHFKCRILTGKRFSAPVMKQSIVLPKSRNNSDYSNSTRVTISVLHNENQHENAEFRQMEDYYNCEDMDDDELLDMIGNNSLNSSLSSFGVQNM